MELVKRENQKSNFWELSEVSTPRKGDWYNDERIRVQNPTTQQIDYNFYYDRSSGEGQYIYVAEDGIWEDHPVSSAHHLSLTPFSLALHGCWLLHVLLLSVPSFK